MKSGSGGGMTSIVVGTLLRVDQVESLGMGEPMSLRVVGAKLRAVIPRPSVLRFAEVQSVLAHAT